MIKMEHIFKGNMNEIYGMAKQDVKARNFQIDCSAGKVMMQLPGGKHPGQQIDIRGTNQCFMTFLRGLLLLAICFSQTHIIFVLPKNELWILED